MFQEHFDIGLPPNRRAGQILILGFYLDNFRDKNRRKIVKTGARNEKTAQKSKSKSRAGFILILGSKWRRFGGRPIIIYNKLIIIIDDAKDMYINIARPMGRKKVGDDVLIHFIVVEVD